MKNQTVIAPIMILMGLEQGPRPPTKCPVCKGTGQAGGKTCMECNGTGVRG